MNVLILGSEGFIGQHSVNYFSSKGHKVYSADIILKEEKDYVLINPERADYSSLFAPLKLDVCINATGAANVQLSFSNPSIDYILNTANVFEILNSLRIYNPSCKFINLSSAAVYGDPKELPIREDTSVNPLSPYGCHKLYSEYICREFHDYYKLSTISLRIFSVYGEKLKKQLFWDLFTKVKNADSEIELFGTGKESRDFIYIKDLVFAFECIIANGNFDGTVINVASGIEASIEDTASLFIQSYGKKVKVKFIGTSKQGDPINWKADISLLNSLGFKPKFSLEEGINNYCKWLRGRE